MEQLFIEKLELVKKIYNISEKMKNVSLDENLDEFNELVESRQTLMDKVSEIDKKIGVNKENLNYKKVDTEIKSMIKSVIEIDKEISNKIEVQKSLALKKINDIDKNQKLRNYTMDKKYIKESGHFIKFRG